MSWMDPSAHPRLQENIWIRRSCPPHGQNSVGYLSGGALRYPLILCSFSSPCVFMYACLFGSNHIMAITTVNLQNQWTNVSGDFQAYLCEPRIGCNYMQMKILARGDLRPFVLEHPFAEC